MMGGGDVGGLWTHLEVANEAASVNQAERVGARMGEAARTALRQRFNATLLTDAEVQQMLSQPYNPAAARGIAETGAAARSASQDVAQFTGTISRTMSVLAGVGTGFGVGQWFQRQVTTDNEIADRFLASIGDVKEPTERLKALNAEIQKLTVRLGEIRGLSVDGIFDVARTGNTAKEIELALKLLEVEKTRATELTNKATQRERTAKAEAEATERQTRREQALAEARREELQAESPYGRLLQETFDRQREIDKKIAAEQDPVVRQAMERQREAIRLKYDMEMAEYDRFNAERQQREDAARREAERREMESIDRRLAYEEQQRIQLQRSAAFQIQNALTQNNIAPVIEAWGQRIEHAIKAGRYDR